MQLHLYQVEVGGEDWDVAAVSAGAAVDRAFRELDTGPDAPQADFAEEHEVHVRRRAPGERVDRLLDSEEDAPPELAHLVRGLVPYAPGGPPQPAIVMTALEWCEYFTTRNEADATPLAAHLVTTTAL